jgi:hypothetical protein
MAKTLQFRRDTTVNLASVTGAEGELFVDLTKDTLVVMDGSTAGGFPLQRELTAGSGISIVGQTISATGGGASNSFTTIAVAGQSNVVADSTTDTLTLAAGSGISITTNAGSDTVTIAATGGGGGGGVAENIDYSKEITIANTYAYTPISVTYSSNDNFGYISLGVDSNTGGFYSDTSNYSSASYDIADRSITITATSTGTLPGISSLTGKYIQFSISATAYMSEVTSVIESPTPDTYQIFLAANPDGLPQSNGSISGAVVYGTSSQILINSVIGADLLNVLTKLKSGATISNATLFSVTTVGTFTNVSGTNYKVAVDELFKPEPYSVAALTIAGNLAAEATWTFDLDGTFISDSVLAGNVLISDDIITPIAYNSYGELTSGTLTVNGSLDILDNIFIDGVAFEVTPATVGIAVIDKTDAGQTSQSIGLGKNAFENVKTNQKPSLSFAFGESAFSSYTGFRGIAIGYQAARGLTYGTSGVFIGDDVMSGVFGDGIGSYNIAIGSGAGSQVSGISIENTVCIGVSAKTYSGLSTAIGGATEAYGTRSTAIGYGAGSLTRLGTNSTAIGNSAQPSTNNVQNEITLGNSSITTLRCQTTSITALSDARDKKDITTLSAGLNFVSKLKPVAFTWNMRDGGKVDVPDTGFIAQDLQQVQQETGITIPGLVYESNPDKLEASYGKLIPVLVKAIQDLQSEVESLKAQFNK